MLFNSIPSWPLDASSTPLPQVVILKKKCHLALPSVSEVQDHSSIESLSRAGTIVQWGGYLLVLTLHAAEPDSVHNIPYDP